MWRYVKNRPENWLWEHDCVRVTGISDESFTRSGGKVWKKGVLYIQLKSRLYANDVITSITVVMPSSLPVRYLSSCAFSFIFHIIISHPSSYLHSTICETPHSVSHPKRKNKLWKEMGNRRNGKKKEEKSMA